LGNKGNFQLHRFTITSENIAKCFRGGYFLTQTVDVQHPKHTLIGKQCQEIWWQRCKNRTDVCGHRTLRVICSRPRNGNKCRSVMSQSRERAVMNGVDQKIKLLMLSQRTDYCLSLEPRAGFVSNQWRKFWK